MATAEANGNGVLIASNASVTTVAVEVKALRIGSKQMTQAVFRQLHDEDLMEFPMVEFRGIPWGHVNYHADGPLCTGEHLHMVWVKGNELRRDAIYRDPEQYPAAKRHKQRLSSALRTAVEHWAFCRMLADWKPQTDADGRFTFKDTLGGESLTFKLDAEQAAPFIMGSYSSLCHARSEMERELTPMKPSGIPDYDGRPKREVMDALWEQRREKLEHAERARLRARVDQYAWKGASACDLKIAKVDPARKAYADFLHEWERRYTCLAELGQLFIAV